MGDQQNEPQDERGPIIQKNSEKSGLPIEDQNQIIAQIFSAIEKEDDETNLQRTKELLNKYKDDSEFALFVRSFRERIPATKHMTKRWWDKIWHSQSKKQVLEFTVFMAKIFKEIIMQ